MSLVACRMVRITLQYGSSKSSSVGKPSFFVLYYVLTKLSTDNTSMRNAYIQGLPVLLLASSLSLVTSRED